jgi:hypothetical protein
MQKNPFAQQYPSSPAPRNCQKRHGHTSRKKEGLITREQREGQELDKRMSFHYVTSEPRTHTFTLHARPSPLCVADYAKLQSRWSCGEPEKALLSVDIAACLVCARMFIC